MRRASAVACVAVAAAFGVAACGGGDDNSDSTAAATPPATTTGGGGAGGGGSTIDFSTPSGSSLAYNQKDATAKAGSDTISFDNVQAQQHDVKIEDSSGAEVGGTELVASGTATATVDLQP